MESQLWAAQIFLKQMTTICKYVEFSKMGTCGIGGESGKSLGDQVLDISFYFQSMHNKHGWKAEDLYSTVH